MNQQIKSRYTGLVIFECEVPDDIGSGMAMRHALEKAVKAGANLAGTNLAGAYLAGANLAGAYLADSNLADSNLADSNLADSNLADSNLAGAYLAGAYLAGANLTGANLTGANLTGANLAGAKWGTVVINKAPIQIYGMRWKVTILDCHMQIGCELHSLDEWAAFDDAQIAGMDGKDALRFWRSYKDVLLGMAAAAGRLTKNKGEKA